MVYFAECLLKVEKATDGQTNRKTPTYKQKDTPTDRHTYRNYLSKFKIQSKGI